MIRAVFDTNVLVSALLSPGSPPAKLLEIALQGKIRLILSPLILAELKRVFSSPKLHNILRKQKIMPGEVAEALANIIKAAVVTPGELSVEAVTEDPADKIIVAGALEGQADFIASGDHHLMALKTVQGIEIVTPGAFWQAFSES